MRVLAVIQRYPVLAAGLAVAATCGVMLGAAVHPDLSGPGVGGPRMLVPYGGARAELISAGGGWSGSSPVAPEYVVGTDWTHPKATPEPVAEADDLDEPTTLLTDASEYAPPSRARIWEDEVPPPRYPSLSGNAAYADDDDADAASDVDPTLDD